MKMAAIESFLYKDTSVKKELLPQGSTSHHLLLFLLALTFLFGVQVHGLSFDIISKP